MISQAAAVESYIRDGPPERRPARERLRALCRGVYPDPQEGIGHGMPVRQAGRTCG